MKVEVGKKYKCTQPLHLFDYGISGQNAIENCKNSIVTIERIRGDGAKIKENGWWVAIKHLVPVTKILKYNKDKL